MVNDLARCRRVNLGGQFRMPLVWLLILVLGVGSGCSVNAPTSQPSSPTRENEGPPVAWRIDPDSYSDHVALFVLDYQTLKLKRAYLTQQGRCGNVNPGASDTELRSRAGAIFYATEFDWRSRFATSQGFRRIGDFVVQELSPVDFGGVAVSHPCSGAVIYAATIVWAGLGHQIYPTGALSAGDLKIIASAIVEPRSFDVLVGAGAEDKIRNELAAWGEVKKLNLARDLATAPYSVLLYLYGPRVGFFDATQAEWLVFVHRGDRQNQRDPSAPGTTTPTR